MQKIPYLCPCCAEESDGPAIQVLYPCVYPWACAKCGEEYHVIIEFRKKVGPIYAGYGGTTYVYDSMLRPAAKGSALTPTEGDKG